MESNRVRIHRESDSTLGLFSQVTDSITIPSGSIRLGYSTTAGYLHAIDVELTLNIGAF